MKVDEKGLGQCRCQETGELHLNLKKEMSSMLFMKISIKGVYYGYA